MSNKIYPIGIQNFDKLRKEGYFYIDKYPLFATYRCRLSVGAQNIGYGSSSTTAKEGAIQTLLFIRSK